MKIDRYTEIFGRQEMKSIYIIQYIYVMLIFVQKQSQLCLFQHFRANVQTNLNIILKLVQNGTLISLFSEFHNLQWRYIDVKVCVYYVDNLHKSISED